MTCRYMAFRNRVKYNLPIEPSWILLSACLLLCGAYVYFDYITFKKLFVFSVGPSDTLYQFFPWLCFYSKNVTDFSFPFWSFQFELGMNIYTFSINHNPFDLILALTGKKNLIYLIPYIVVLKMIVAGLFFYAFLRKIHLSQTVALICSLAFSFSGYMIVNGHWHHYPNYAVFLAITLFCFERWFQDGRWFALVLVIGLLHLKGILQLAQFVLFFIVYIPFRCFFECQEKPVYAAIRSLLVFFLLFGLGIGISAFYLLPNLDIITESARSTHSINRIGGLEGFFQNILSVTSITQLKLVFLRYLSSDILGYFHHRGEGNYLESAAGYIGVSLLSIISGIIWVRSPRKKIAFMTLLAICLSYFLFQSIRVAFNLFASPSYKYGVLYVSTLLILVAGFSLDNFFNRPDVRKRFATSTAVFIFLVLGGVNYLSNYSEYSSVIDFDLVRMINFTLVVFLLIILIYSFYPSRRLRYAIVVFVVIEIVIFSKITINTVQEEGNLTPEHVKSGECYFDKDSNAAVEYLKKMNTGFFRIAKDDHACTLNDSLVQGYNGTTGYLGFASNGLVTFYSKLGLSRRSPRLTSIRYGFERSPYLLSLFCVKYYIADDPLDFPEGFKLIKRIGERYVYENLNYLPLGVALQHQIPFKEFNMRPPLSRHALLLRGFIGEERDQQIVSRSKLDPVEIKNITVASAQVNEIIDGFEAKNIKLMASRYKHGFHYITKNEEPIIRFSLKEKRYINENRHNRLEIKLDIESDSETTGRMFWTENHFTESPSFEFRIKKGNHNYSIPLGKIALQKLKFVLGNKGNQEITVNKISLLSKPINGETVYKRVVDLFDYIEFDNLKILAANDTHGFHYMAKNKDPQIILPLDKEKYFNDLKIHFRNLTIEFDIESDSDTIGQLFWTKDYFTEKSSSIFRVQKGRHTHTIPMGKAAITSLRIDVGNKAGEEISIHKVQLSTKRIVGINLQEAVSRLRPNSLNITNYSSDHLEGTIETDMTRMLFFAIPYDKGWSAWLDGKKQPIEKINFGFMGFEIPPGEHTVELRFRPSWFYEGIFISIVSLFIALLIRLRFPVFNILASQRTN